ncbi:MAG: phosphatidylserine decarboxylase [Clostridia bacterium]|nr:phosphatidylserine decarboxylase [Clostridia bacterium]
MTVDRSGAQLDDRQENAGLLRFLYGNAFGRICLKLFSSRTLSRIVGAYMSSPLSKGRARRCLKRYGVRTEELEKDRFSSFNDFFTRKKKPEFLSVESDPDLFPSPADSRVTVTRLTDGNAFPVKGAPYTVQGLLESEEEAAPFRDGWAFVFRLAPSDYHRYVYPDGGTAERSVFLPGVLHTVSPVATEKIPVFHRNCREKTLLHTDRFGTVAYVEVGAMMVGKIVNHPKEPGERFERGEEKGYFAFGGSTIVVLVRNREAEPDPEILRNSLEGNETRVKLGEHVARKPADGGRESDSFEE